MIASSQTIAPNLSKTLALPQFSTDTVRPSFARGPRQLSDIKLLRLSVTDRCNFRCTYCMPEVGTPFVPGDELLSADEILAVASAAYQAGVRYFKLTGGEPLLRKDLIEIVARLRAMQASDDPIDISLTTNGYFLAEQAQPLKDAGLDRVTVSWDSMDKQTLVAIARGQTRKHDNTAAIIRDGLDALDKAGFRHTKINTVVIGGVNDHEVADFAALSLHHDWTIRFIEYMPLGDATLTDIADGYTVDNAIIKERIEAAHGDITTFNRKNESGVGPANVFQIKGAKGRLGFISAMSQPFCETCNRLRLTATGELRSCLFDGGEINVKPMLENAASLQSDTLKQDIIKAMHDCTQMKPATHQRRGNRAMNQLGG